MKAMIVLGGVLLGALGLVALTKLPETAQR